MRHDLLWFEEYAENAEVLKPLTPQEWKELATLLHEVNSAQGRSDRPACAVCGAAGATTVEVWDAGGRRIGDYHEWKETRALCETCSDSLTVCEGCYALISDNVSILGLEILCPDCKAQGRSDRPAAQGEGEG